MHAGYCRSQLFQRNSFVFLHGSIVVFGGLPGPYGKSEKNNYVFCLKISHTYIYSIECACAEKRSVSTIAGQLFSDSCIANKKLAIYNSNRNFV